LTLKIESNINETPKGTSTVGSGSYGVLLMPIRTVDLEKQCGQE